VIDLRRDVLGRLLARVRCAAGAIVSNPLHVLAIAAITAFGCLVALAQFQVNRSVGQPVYGGGGGGGGGSVRYGYVSPVAPRSSDLLPSELRNSYYRSGALPSEIRMNARAAGPLVSASSYIPGTGSPVIIRASAEPAVNYANLMAPRTIGSAGIPLNPSVKYGKSATQAPWSAPVATARPAPALAIQKPGAGATPLPTMSSNPYGTIHFPATAAKR